MNSSIFPFVTLLCFVGIYLPPSVVDAVWDNTRRYPTAEGGVANVHATWPITGTLTNAPIDCSTIAVAIRGAYVAAGGAQTGVIGVAVTIDSNNAPQAYWSRSGTHDGHIAIPLLTLGGIDVRIPGASWTEATWATVGVSSRQGALSNLLQQTCPVRNPPFTPNTNWYEAVQGQNVVVSRKWTPNTDYTELHAQFMQTQTAARVNADQARANRNLPALTTPIVLTAAQNQRLAALPALSVDSGYPVGQCALAKLALYLTRAGAPQNIICVAEVVNNANPIDVRDDNGHRSTYTTNALIPRSDREAIIHARNESASNFSSCFCFSFLSCPTCQKQVPMILNGILSYGGPPPTRRHSFGFRQRKPIHQGELRPMGE